MRENYKKDIEECKEATEVKEASLKNYEEAKSETDTIFVIDCETGGLNPEIHSILDIHFKSLQSDFKRTFKFRPTGAITHEALCVNNLNWVDLLSREKIKSIAQASELIEIMDRMCILIGHNIDFDIKFLGTIITNPKCYAICTKSLAKKLYKGLSSYSLENLSRYTVGEYDESKAHTAEYDCYLTERLLKKILKDDTENILKLKWLATELNV